MEHEVFLTGRQIDLLITAIGRANPSEFTKPEYLALVELLAAAKRIAS